MRVVLIPIFPNEDFTIGADLSLLSNDQTFVDSDGEGFVQRVCQCAVECLKIIRIPEQNHAFLLIDFCGKIFSLRLGRRLL